MHSSPTISDPTLASLLVIGGGIALQQEHAPPDALNALVTRSHHALTADI